MKALLEALSGASESADSTPNPSGSDDLDQRVLERAMKAFRRARESGDEELAKEALDAALDLLED